ncbi:MAG: ferritin family protein [Chloroflexota bacterium]|nr:ferritin family protein [Chloroflexota bacterium]
MRPLEIALRMETEGKSFYQEASQKINDSLGRELFMQLSGEEDLHARKAKEIYDNITQIDALSIEDLSFDRGVTIKSIFAKAKETIVDQTQVASDVFEVIRIALDMEEKSRQFYQEQSSSAETEIERRFFSALMAEEKGHYLSLADYKEYLTNPSGWFTNMEHHSLDGG